MTDTKPEALRLAEEGMRLHTPNAPEYIISKELCRLHEVNAKLLEALKAVFPNNLNAINKNVPDTTVIPLDFTYGELRKISAAIAKAEVTK
jgi:hypothetical protein